MTLIEFKKFYEEKGYLPNDIQYRQNKLNDKQIKTRYEKYLKSSAKKEYTIDEDWQAVKDQLDLKNCQFLKRLEDEKMFDEIKELKNNAVGFIKIIDPAHIFSKSSCPFLKYDVDNVVPLNRYSHSCLDTMKDPINGKPITQQERDLFWMFIAGIEIYQLLLEKKSNYAISKLK